eukprot:6195869-Pleurochrysis_carterae.AAC.2
MARRGRRATDGARPRGRGIRSRGLCRNAKCGLQLEGLTRVCAGGSAAAPSRSAKVSERTREKHERLWIVVGLQRGWALACDDVEQLGLTAT